MQDLKVVAGVKLGADGWRTPLAYGPPQPSQLQGTWVHSTATGLWNAPPGNGLPPATWPHGSDPAVPASGYALPWYELPQATRETGAYGTDPAAALPNPPITYPDLGYARREDGFPHAGDGIWAPGPDHPAAADAAAPYPDPAAAGPWGAAAAYPGPAAFG